MEGEDLDPLGPLSTGLEGPSALQSITGCWSDGRPDAGESAEHRAFSQCSDTVILLHPVINCEHSNSPWRPASGGWSIQEMHFVCLQAALKLYS